MTHTRYIGDAVYAHFDGHHVMLTTGHHDPAQASNIIALDPSVVAELERYVKDLKESLDSGENQRERL